MITVRLEHLKHIIRQREHQGVSCYLLHFDFRQHRDDYEKFRALVEWSHILAMTALQSERYVTYGQDMYREAVDNVMDLVREYVPDIIAGRFRK